MGSSSFLYAEECYFHLFRFFMILSGFHFLFLFVLVLFSKLSSYQGPLVQNIVSLTSSLVVKILIVLVSTISNSQVFLLKKKNVSSFCKCKNYLHFFSKNTSTYAIFNNQRFKDT